MRFVTEKRVLVLETSNDPPPIPPPYPPRWFEGVCADCGRESSVTFIKDNWFLTYPLHHTKKSTTKWVCNQCNRKRHYEYIDCDLAKKGII